MTFVVLTGSDSFNRLGWMVGTGVEYAVTNNLILKAEYNYVDFGSNNETLTINSTLSGAATAKYQFEAGDERREVRRKPAIQRLLTTANRAPGRTRRARLRTIISELASPAGL